MNETKYHLSTPMGIHRLMREPYDDREIFSNMDDLYAYCKEGARYTGQKVGCILGSRASDIYVQNFTIVNDFPVPDLKNGEHIFLPAGPIPNGENGYVDIAYPAILVYRCGRGRTFARKSHCNYLYDPNAYSLLNILDAFRDSEKYNFIIKVETPDDGKEYFTHISNISYDFLGTTQNAFIDNPFGIYRNAADSNNAFASCVCYGKDYEKTVVSIIPYRASLDNTNTNTTVELYLIADNYVKCLGER